MKTLSSKNIILVGMPASGKSSVGNELARMLKYGFLDVDRLISKIGGKSIQKIIEDDGEEALRQFEKSAILNLKDIKNHVISVGGGAFENEENRRNLSKIGTVVWIECIIPVIARRLLKKNGLKNELTELKSRPLLKDTPKDQVEEKLETLLSQRKDNYKEADLRISLNYSPPEQGAYHVYDLLQYKIFKHTSKFNKNQGSFNKNKVTKAKEIKKNNLESELLVDKNSVIGSKAMSSLGESNS